MEKVVEEVRVKRTDKFKKKTYGGFYSEYLRVDPKGKSGKVKDGMIADLKNNVTHQLARIKRLKYVIQIYRNRDDGKAKLQKLKTKEKSHEKKLVVDKLKRRDEKIDNILSEVEEAENIIKLQDKEIARLNREVDRKDNLVEEVRSQKRRGYTRVVKEKLNTSARRIQRIADKGVGEREINSLEYTIRTLSFLKENNVSLEELTVISQADLLGNVKTSDLVTGNYRMLNKLSKDGYLAFSAGLTGAKKYWFISLEGRKFLKKYRDYLSYGKSILNK